MLVILHIISYLIHYSREETISSKFYSFAILNFILFCNMLIIIAITGIVGIVARKIRRMRSFRRQQEKY